MSLSPRSLPGAIAFGRNTGAGGYGWFFRHELRLSVRDWIKPGKEWRTLIGSLLLLVCVHIVGWLVAVGMPDADSADPAVRHQAEIMIIFGLVAVFGMLTAQAMEAVARAVYTRGDLDLIMSSPASSQRLFVVRMVTSAFTTLWLAGFFVLPVVNMLALLRGWHWLAAHGVLLALSLGASALALALTYGLFRLFGPRRTRTLAQALGAVIGAATVIGAQVPFILRSGTMSTTSMLRDPWFASLLPKPGSLFYAPAAASHGDMTALFAVLALSLAAFAIVVGYVSQRFAGMALVTAGLPEASQNRGKASRFRPARSPVSALRGKELRLILRDPWLLSQSMMQILYLIPPALLLWRNFGDEVGRIAMLVPVLVMATAQLAGGLAWLTLSAEDARDLIDSAPVTPAQVLRAKIEAVLVGVGAVALPFLLLFSLQSLLLAALALLFCTIGSASNCLIQVAFQTEARRSQFRMRQRASRLATMCETLVAVAWAAAAGFTAAESYFAAMIPAGIALILLGGCAITYGRRPRLRLLTQ